MAEDGLTKNNVETIETYLAMAFGTESHDIRHEYGAGHLTAHFIVEREQDMLRLDVSKAFLRGAQGVLQLLLGWDVAKKLREYKLLGITIEEGLIGFDE